MNCSSLKRALGALALGMAAAGCQNTAQRPLPLAPQVDLERFVGTWYVIAATPTLIDGDAFDAVEAYRRDADGTIDTTYTFRDGGFDGPQRRYKPRGFVQAGSGNAVWGMQLLWPFRADYRIAYLAADYSQVIVAREKRDYAWIMARTPRIADADFQSLTAFLQAQGYDLTSLRRIPQSDRGPPK